MITGRLIFDISLAILFAVMFAAAVFSYNNWKKHRSLKMFWYLFILIPQLFLTGGILLNNYLGLANEAFAARRLSLVIDDAYWILVAALFKVIIIAIMIYGINQFCIHLMPIPPKRKKRLIVILVLMIILIIISFLIIIKLKASEELFQNSQAIVNGLLFPIGCIIAGTQALSLLIPSIPMHGKGKRLETFCGIMTFIPYLILPAADFIWFINAGIEPYIRLSYFAIIPLLVFVIREVKSDSEIKPNHSDDIKTRIDFICDKFEISEREKDVLFLIVNGKSHQAIADTLYISINTVKSHLQNIYKKMKVSSKIQLLLKINSLNK